MNAALLRHAASVEAAMDLVRQAQARVVKTNIAGHRAEYCVISRETGKILAISSLKKFQAAFDLLLAKHWPGDDLFGSSQATDSSELSSRHP